MQTDPLYPARFARASAEFDYLIRDTVHLVGVHGVEMPVLHKGKQVYIQGQPLFENKRSEQVLLRIAEARLPEYKRHVENTNLMDIDPDRRTPERLDKIAEHLIQQALGSNSSPAAVADVKRRLEAQRRMGLKKTDKLAKDKIETSLQTD